MPDLVRVSDPVLGHFTVTRTRAEALGLTVLKSDAVDRFGKPLAGKPRNQIPAPKKTRTETPEPKKARATEDAPSSAEPKE